MCMMPAVCRLVSYPDLSVGICGEKGRTIRHDDVDLPKLVYCGRHQLLNVGDLGDVGLHGQRAVGADLGDHLVCGLAVGQVVDDDRGAVGGYALGGGAADALGGACDEDDFALEGHGGWGLW